jgi:hypothetical protein
MAILLLAAALGWATGDEATVTLTVDVANI